MSTIRYFLPEDGDTEESPNVFLAPKPTRPGYPPVLGQIRNAFPLPGMYHFRFKTALIPGSDRDKNAVAVWMDCVDDSEPVPTWQGSVVAKVTRVVLDDGEEESFDEDFARAESNVSTGGYSSSRSSIQSSSKPQSTTNHTSHHSSDSLLGAFDDGPTPAPPAPAAPVASANLLDHHTPVPAPPASGGSLLDMDHIAPTASSSGANTPTHHHDELLNMTAPMPTSTPAQNATPVPPQYPPQQQQHQQRPPQVAMQGQYPMQGMGGPMAGQQRMGMMPNQGMGMQQMQQGQQQQFNQSRGSTANNGTGGKNAFDKFSGSSLDPLGNLKWS